MDIRGTAAVGFISQTRNLLLSCECVNNELEQSFIGFKIKKYQLLSNISLFSAGADHSLVHRLPVSHPGVLPCLPGGKGWRLCEHVWPGEPHGPAQRAGLWHLRWCALVGAGTCIKKTSSKFTTSTALSELTCILLKFCCWKQKILSWILQIICLEMILAA